MRVDAGLNLSRCAHPTPAAHVRHRVTVSPWACVCTWVCVCVPTEPPRNLLDLWGDVLGAGAAVISDCKPKQRSADASGGVPVFACSAWLLVTAPPSPACVRAPAAPTPLEVTCVLSAETISRTTAASCWFARSTVPAEFSETAWPDVCPPPVCLCLCVWLCVAVRVCPHAAGCVAQDLIDVALLHSWCLYVVAAVESRDFVALRQLMSPTNVRHTILTEAQAGKGAGGQWRLVHALVVSSVLASVRNKAVHLLGERCRPHHADYKRVDPSAGEETEDAAAAAAAPAVEAVQSTAAGVMGRGGFTISRSGPAAGGAGKPADGDATSRARVFSADGENSFSMFRRRLSSDGLGDNVIADAIAVDDGPVSPAEAVRRAAAPGLLAKTVVEDTLTWFDTYLNACMRFLVSANVLALMQAVAQVTPTRALCAPPPPPLPPLRRAV